MPLVFAFDQQAKREIRTLFSTKGFTLTPGSCVMNLRPCFGTQLRPNFKHEKTRCNANTQLEQFGVPFVMLNTNAQREVARAELTRSYDLSPYEAVDVAWVAIIKLANLLSGASEHKRLLALLELLPPQRIQSILSHDAVDTLLNLEPSLESVLKISHERLDVKRTAQELAVVRQHRIDEPKLALLNLAEVLKHIRNRRAHGFKTLYSPRDQEILGAAASLLQAVGEAALDVVET